LLVTLPIMFLVLGIVAKLFDGALVEVHSHGEMVIQATKYVFISSCNF
jgi:hypothetical protein